jgi:cation/acetate symporter
MAGIISFDGYDGAVYLMGWTGDMFCSHIATYLENLGIYRSRFYWRTLTPLERFAVICALVVLRTQDKRGVGLVFSKF